MVITHERVYLPTETLGSWYDSARELLCKVMELPWLDNKNNISCIPEGTYKIVKMKPGYGRDYSYFRFVNVPGRTINKQLGLSSILVHPITFVKDLKGCQGVGSRFKDLNNDGVPDIIESKKKLQWLVDNLPDEFTLVIKEKGK